MTIKRATSAFLASLLAFAMLTFTMADASAKQGGAKVDDDDTCEDVDREENSFESSDDSFVWLNLGNTGITPEDYRYELFHKGQSVAGGDLEFVDDCDPPFDGYWVAEFDLPEDPGAYTLVVYDADGNRVSSDSFRLVAD